MKNQNEFQDSRYFRTSSFYTACFLYSKNFSLVNIDKVTDRRRAYFVFLDTPEREQLTNRFNYGNENDPETMVDSRVFVAAIKQLKDKLYQEDYK